MEYLELHPVTPQKRFIEKAIEVLKNGGVIIYPTDTFYGMGCSIYETDALDRIFKLNNQSKVKLYSFIIPDFKDIAKYAKVSDFAFKTMKKLLPGPYTFILPAVREVPKKLWSKRKTVGIRIPDHPIAIELSRELGHPIVSTTVKDDTGAAIYDPEVIRDFYNLRVDLMLSAGPLQSQPSSVVDLSLDEPEVIREGAGDISYFQ